MSASVPPRERGNVAKEVYTLDMIQKHKDNNTLHELGRAKDMLDRMFAHTDKMKTIWRSMGDYILSRLFGFEYETDPDSSLYRAIPDTGKMTTLFVPNDFPYNTEEGIDHWLLWSLTPIPDEEARAFLDAKLVDSDGKVLRYVYFVNPVAVRSIKEVSHYHVFFKKWSLAVTAP
eukprot:TRINITY_DN7034_c0_g1_i1.p1 TRINITY_DN7034_c0_g1~~TRINITY_DN7034_c0_g1_i1.p1  ORF type:complete len:181 (-),score=25.78 TRINITY_DN7034_c0_g1_i1:39-560(-)